MGPVGEGAFANLAQGLGCLSRFPFSENGLQEVGFGRGFFEFVEEGDDIVVEGGVEAAGVRDFDSVVAELDGVAPVFFFLDGSQLIDATEGWLLIGSDKLGADTPGVDFGTVGFELLDGFDVEVVAGDDAGFGIAGFVEELARGDAESAEVARVEADASEGVALGFEFVGDLNGLFDAFGGVEGIDEEGGVVRSRFSVGAKGVELVIKAHDPAVGVGSFDGHVELLAGKNVRSSIAAPEVGGPTGTESSIGTLRTPQSELENGIALGSFTNARCLSGDEGLEVDDVEEGCFDELALQNGTTHL